MSNAAQAAVTRVTSGPPCDPSTILQLERLTDGIPYRLRTVKREHHRPANLVEPPPAGPFPITIGALTSTLTGLPAKDAIEPSPRKPRIYYIDAQTGGHGQSGAEHIELRLSVDRIGRRTIFLFAVSPGPSHRSDAFSSLDSEALRKLVYALLREGTHRVAVSRRGTFVDFDISAVVPLSQRLRLRFRLFFDAPKLDELSELVSEALASGLHPIAIAPYGASESPLGLTVVRTAELQRLCEQSGVIQLGNGTFTVDRDAFRELQDSQDPRIALLNGLLWLRPLSRDRVPPALRWTGTPAHELFERCFFLSVVSTFDATGVRWGTGARGRPIPDGRLAFRGLAAPVLYDCKASRRGYEMTYRDLTGFVDYLVDPIESDWKRPKRGALYFLLVSSEFIESSPSTLFRRRQEALQRKARGAQLVWIRAPDLARFGLAIERANVAHAHRTSIPWRAIFNAGDVRWLQFNTALDGLRKKHGYSFDGV